ncbi:hypothetical protein Z043_103063 [Scleropages formosus]|uniref:Uncharacterized protein n=1 Tax=Scleropages formosus TaxID=113540 RepID=A0A0P7V600_SCLFO|nr:hypothetical protein Z043_103063 [Scleropages formosus]
MEVKRITVILYYLGALYCHLLAQSVNRVVIYFHTQVVDGQRKIICLLQEQIESEGEDKKFLIRRLQAIHEQRRPRPVQRPTPLGSEVTSGDGPHAQI